MTSITNEYVKSKQRAQVRASYRKHADKINSSRRAKYAKQKQTEQPSLPVPDSRPTTGPTCRVCGKVLMPYDIERGECFVHPIARLRAWRNQPVRMTAETRSE